MANTDNLDPRIGTLNSGKFYAYVNGYSAEPTTGTREEVEIALGLRIAVRGPGPAPKAPTRSRSTYRVSFRNPEGYTTAYDVETYTAREARQKASDLFREDHPSRAGFYSVASCTITTEKV